MCGIVGLFLKDKSLEPQLGQMLTGMLITMTDRGPDSAGIAIYGTDADDQWKLTVQSANPDADFEGLDAALGKACGTAVKMTRKDTHAVLEMAADKIGAARQFAFQRLALDLEADQKEEHRHPEIVDPQQQWLRNDQIPNLNDSRHVEEVDFREAPSLPCMPEPVDDPEERERWAARTLDIDLLLCGELVMTSPQLTLPHPRLAERQFVLEPLCDLAPELVHPHLGLSYRQLLERLKGSSAIACRGAW